MLKCEETRRSPAALKPLLLRGPGMGLQFSLAAACAAALSLCLPAAAKTPGEVHCYNGICHRVKTVEEMALLVGKEHDAVTSYYDTAERDSMNAGDYTSSGERFDASSESHAASSLYPDGTELLIWHPKNRHAAHIRVNDFGPFYMLRTIDVTRRVAELLDFNKTGVARLRVAVVWAPSPEAARFRRRRSYPAVEGYVGRLDYDQFVALKARLIATGPDRNPAPFMVAKSLTALPAFAGAQASPAERIKAAALNAPRMPLAAKEPALSIKSVGTGRAIASTGRAELPLIAAHEEIVSGDGEATSLPAATTVATLAAPVVVPVVREPAAEAPVPQAAVAIAAPGLPWQPNALLWQQLLAALAFLTLATTAWRARFASGRPSGMPASQGLAVIIPPVAAAATGPDNVVMLPQPARSPSSVAMDTLRDEAAAHMETYAFGAAEIASRRLLAARVEIFGAAHPLCADAERQLADCLRDQGRYNAAEPHYRRALANMIAAMGEQHPAVGDVLDAFAVSLLRQGRGLEAERTAYQSLSIRRQGGTATREYAATLSIVAETLRAQGQLAAAEAEHRSAWAHFIALSGESGLDAAASMTSIGTVLGEMGRFGPAEDMLNAGTRILSTVSGYDHPISATGYALLGDLYRRAGALDAARTMQTHALGIRERILGDGHPDTIETMLSLALIATEQYRVSEARSLLDRALDRLVAGERHALGPQSRVRGLLVALSHQHDVSEPHKAAAE